MGSCSSVSKSSTGAGGNAGSYSYKAFPLSTTVLGGRFATKEEKAEASKTVSKFMDNAKTGDVYRMGGIGSTNNSTFEIVNYNRSPNKLGIKVNGRNTVVSMLGLKIMVHIECTSE